MSKTSVTYYCTKRPPAPLAIPDNAIMIVRYPERRYSPVIDRMVWGAVTYQRELTFDEVELYALTREPRENEP